MNELDEPLRLLRQGGHWTLEVTRLIAIDRHVLRPERRQVRGTDSVVRHLKERYAPALVREALDLIVTEDDGSDRTFTLENEHWVQLASEDAPGPGRALQDLSQVVRSLRGELTTLRAMHEALRDRMAHLERRQARTPAYEARSSLRPPARREPAGVSLRPGSGRAQAAEPSPEALVAHAKTELSRADAVVARELAAPAAAVPAAVPSPAPGKPRLSVPQHVDVVTCLRQLLGSEPELRHERGPAPAELGGFLVSRVIDASDEEVGAILLDRMAGAELAGRLLGLPENATEENAKAEPSSDLLDAMNEVTNNLGGFINRANQDLRVRVRPLEPYDAAVWPWLAKCNASVGSTTKTGGRLWISACPPREAAKISGLAVQPGGVGAPPNHETHDEKRRP